MTFEPRPERYTVNWVHALQADEINWLSVADCILQKTGTTILSSSHALFGRGEWQSISPAPEPGRTCGC